MGLGSFRSGRAAAPVVVLRGSDLRGGRDYQNGEWSYRKTVCKRLRGKLRYCFSAGVSAGLAKSLGSSCGLSSNFLNSALLVSWPFCLF